MKKSIIAGAVLVGSALLFSSLAHAQTSQDLLGGIGTLDELITTFNTTVVKSLGTLFLSLGVVAFFFGVVQYIWGIREGNEKKATDGKQFMIWGLVGLFVMFSVYGIIKFGQSIIFGNKDVNIIDIPTIRINGSGNTSGSPSTNPLVPSNNSGSPSTNPVVGAGPSDTRANGSQCTFGSQCASGYCQSTQLGSQCAAAPSSGGASTALKADGAQCTFSSECQSQNCQSTPVGTQCITLQVDNNQRGGN